LYLDNESSIFLYLLLVLIQEVTRKSSQQKASLPHGLTLQTGPNLGLECFATFLCPATCTTLHCSARFNSEAVC
jgi:hypothetical protein